MIRLGIRRGASALAHLLTSLVLGPVAFGWALVTTLVSGVLSFTYLARPRFSRRPG